MLLDQATDVQMQAARVFGGATMVALLAAPLFRRQARRARLVVAGVYIMVVLGFVAYVAT